MGVGLKGKIWKLLKLIHKVFEDACQLALLGSSNNFSIRKTFS